MLATCLESEVEVPYGHTLTKGFTIMRLAISTLIAASLLTLAACSSHQPKQLDSRAHWVKDGSILLSRPLPQPSEILGSTRVLGFMPSKALEQPHWLRIRLDSGEVNLMTGPTTSSTFSNMSSSGIARGTFQIQLKQTSPTWYASDEYFTARHLEVPAQGEASRYLKGVFGTQAIFLDTNTAIHTGKLDTPEVQGIQLSDEAMAEIYDALAVGSSVVVE